MFIAPFSGCLFRNSSCGGLLRYVMFVALFAAAGANAASVEGIYSAEVPAENRSAEARNAAVPDALRHVLVKVTGDRGARIPGRYPDLFATANQFLASYRYRVDGGQILLKVSFDQAAVDRYLRENNEQVWGQQRPLTLVLLAVNDGTERYVLGGGADQPDALRLTALLNQAADNRGLSLLFPLMDITDQARFSATDIAGGFDRDALEAAGRYRADSVLVGSMAYTAQGAAKARWRLYEESQLTDSWTSGAATLAKAIALGVDESADIYAGRISAAGEFDKAEAVRLIVQDVFSVDDYARLMRYVRSLSDTTAVSLVRAEDEHLELSVKLASSLFQLEQAISLGHVLAVVVEDRQSGDGFGLVSEPESGFGNTGNDQLLPNEAEAAAPTDPNVAVRHYRLLR